MKSIRKILLLCIPLILAFVLAGCGAVVSTEMTADKNFKGSRVITLEIADDDLAEVTGGIDGLETVIKDNIPKGMSYKIEAYEGGQTITFTISFKDIKDYRSKVNTIIKAGITEEEKETDLMPVPEVIYERSESYFKKGIRFSENFTSVELLDWFREGLREAEIIAESESNWYENGTHILTIEDKEYSGSTFMLEDQELNCLSDCKVNTDVAVDNSLTRTITFTAYENTIEALKAKGCVLDEYLKALAPEGCEFTAEQQDGGTIYTFVIKAANAEELVTKTNAIMQTDTNTVTLESTVDPEKPGYAKVVYSELIDASFYMNYDGYSSPVTSFVKVYNNTDVTGATVGDSEFYYSETDGGVQYRPSASQEYKFNMDWQIEFEEIALSMAAKGEKKFEVELDCKLSDDLSEEMKQSAIDRMKSFFESDKAYKVKDNSFVITFSGKTEQVVADINKAILAADDVTDNGYDQVFFAVDQTKLHTSSIFTNGTAASVTYDFTPLLGDVALKVEEKDGLFGSKYYEGDAYENEEGDRFVPAEGSVELYETKLSILGIFLGVLTLAFLAFGVLWLLKNLKSFVEYLKHMKQAKAEKAAAQAATPAVAPQVEIPQAEIPQAVAPQEQPVTVPPVEQAPAQTNDYEEEDVL